MTSKDDAEFCLEQLKDKVGLGAQVISFLVDPGSDDEWGEDYGFGLLVKTKENEEIRLWISADPEGNGPGFVHIEEHTA